MVGNKNKLVMCKDYLGFGTVSLVVGTIFMLITVLTTVTFVRAIVVGFFIVLGAIDLVLYSIFRERH